MPKYKADLHPKALAAYRWMQKVARHVREARTYEGWIYGEGIPVYETLAGVADARELPREDWPRVGGRGTFIQMLGLYQSERGMYVVEIPARGALHPERHLYHEFFFVLQGRGATEIWQEGMPKVTFEWKEGSAFTMPLNAWHRLFNGSSEPALVLALTTAPKAMNTFHNSEFVFNCDYKFTDEFAGENDYFTRVEELRHGDGWRNRLSWYTKFIPDVRSFQLVEEKITVWGGKWLGYRMGWPSTGHISQWPVGVYHKAHRHQAGAILIGLSEKGYVLLWPYEAGARPYENGHGDQVVKVEWGRYSVYTPPDNWYHQHFNIGREPAHQIAVHQSDHEGGSGVDFGEFTEVPVMVSEVDGGTMIDYEDEDPAIRRNFEEELAKIGIACAMPSVGLASTS